MLAAISIPTMNGLTSTASRRGCIFSPDYSWKPAQNRAEILRFGLLRRADFPGATRQGSPRGVSMSVEYLRADAPDSAVMPKVFQGLMFER
jgi:hypothetical protein